MPATATTSSRLLDLTTGEEQLPVEFLFDDTSFVYNDLSSRTYILPYYFVSLSDTHLIDLPNVRVPLSHVLSASISDKVVDVNVLEKGHSGLKLIKLSGFLQTDNAKTRSSANDWVQAAMSAAYTGASRAIHVAYHK
jgi:hypothetical protein